MRAEEVKHEEWGGKRKVVSTLRAVICILLIAWAGREQTPCTQAQMSPPSIRLFLVTQSSTYLSHPCKQAPFLLTWVLMGLLCMEVKERGFPAVGLAFSERTAGRFIAVPQPSDYLNLCEDSLRKPHPSQPHLADAQFQYPGKRVGVGPVPSRWNGL